MNNQRKPTDRMRTRQAVDGILNAPANRGRVVQNAPRAHSGPVFRDRLTGSHVRTRLIGDFNQSEGYHSSDYSTAGRVQNASQKPVTANPNDDQHIRKQFADSNQTSAKRSKRLLFGRRNQSTRARKQKSSWKRWALRGGLAVFLLVFALGGYLFANGYLNMNKIFQGGGAAVALDKKVDPTQLRGEGDGRVNILLLGRGGDGHDGADLTDTIMIASIDPVNKKAALVSVPRDLWVKGKYNSSKINAVFAYAKNAALSDGISKEESEKKGIQATESIIEDILGINIHYYAMIDFAGFEQAVNTLGGVTIDVPEELRDSTMAWQNNKNPVLAKAGIQKMDGHQALMYVRSRHGSARGDFDRAERQRIFLVALKNQIMTAGTYSNPVKVSRLMNDFGSHTKTDFSLNDIMRLYSLSSGIKTFESIGFVDAPHDFLTTDMYSGQSVVVPKAGMYEYDQISTYIRTALPDGYIVKENAPITVLNGSMVAGVATQKADELKSYAYNVTTVDTAPTQDYTKTVIVNLGGNNKYTQNYLEKRFGVSATTKIPTGIVVPTEKHSGFIIIIGQNEANNR